MKNYPPGPGRYAALLVFLCCCNGQGKTDGPETSANASPAAEESHPRIIRTQGTQSGVVGCELVDRDGNIWFSISGEGVYRYDGTSFTNFTTKDGLCSNHTGTIIQDRAGNILIGTNRGICRYDGTSFTRYTPDTSSITSILEDRDGNIWFGTMAHGVYRYDGKTLSNFLHGSDHKFNLGSNNQLILDILQDTSGNIWFSSWNGGGVWRYDGTSFKNFVPSPEYYTTHQDKRGFAGTPSPRDYASNGVYTPAQDHITDDMIFSITQDKAGTIWFATRDHGICRYDGKTFTTISKKEGFSSRGAYKILEDRKGNLWFTTERDGVWRYDGTSFKNFTEKDGLVNNAVLSILEDNDGNIWFGTKWLGLSRYDGERFVTFSEAGG